MISESAGGLTDGSADVLLSGLRLPSINSTDGKVHSANESTIENLANQRAQLVLEAAKENAKIMSILICLHQNNVPHVKRYNLGQEFILKKKQQLLHPAYGRM